MNLRIHSVDLAGLNPANCPDFRRRIPMVRTLGELADYFAILAEQQHNLLKLAAYSLERNGGGELVPVIDAASALMSDAVDLLYRFSQQDAATAPPAIPTTDEEDEGIMFYRLLVAMAIDAYGYGPSKPKQGQRVMKRIQGSLERQGWPSKHDRIKPILERATLKTGMKPPGLQGGCNHGG